MSTTLGELVSGLPQSPADLQGSLDPGSQSLSARHLPHQQSAPVARTLEMVLDELKSVRCERERYLKSDRLKLAAECCVEIEQLARELAALRELLDE